MRVLHVISSVSPKQGGPSVAVLEMARHLAGEGIVSTIAATRFDLGEQRIDWPDLHLFDAPVLGRYGFSPQLLAWLRRNAGNYDLVVLHDFHNFTTLACLAALRPGQPWIVRPCGELDDHSAHRAGIAAKLFAAAKRGLFGIAVAPAICRRATFHFTSAAERDRAVQYLGRPLRSFVVPLGINLPDSPPAKRNRGAALLCIARLHPVKGIEFLIEGFRLLQRQLPSASLTIAGTGEADYMASLQLLAAGIPNLRFAGHVAGMAKADLFAQADLFVLPSYHENFGVAVAEALAQSVPVLVTREVQIAPEILAAGAGQAILRDLADISRAALAILQNPVLGAEMAEKAAKLANQAFGWPAVAHQLALAYRGAAPARL